MSERSSITSVLLWIFAIAMVLGTLVSLGLGFDVFVQPPDVPDSATLPTRLMAMLPFSQAVWPYDAVATLLFVIGFGALATAAGGIASLGGGHTLAGTLRAVLTISGILGVVAGLVYFGATKITTDMSYCDCGYVEPELISRFWALAIVQGASDWVSHGAVIFGAIGAALSARVLGRSGLPSGWSAIAWGSAALLVLGLILNELTDTPVGDLAVAIATGILLPIWAILLARLDLKA